MFRFLIFCFCLFLSIFETPMSFADSWGNCCDYQTLEIGVGWRRDNLKWNAKNIKGGQSEYPTKVDSDVCFNDIDMYALDGKLKFLGAHYYVRLAGSYAISYKGRVKEDFKIETPCLFYCDEISIHTNNHIKRQSEFYDFNLAVGYPFLFCDCKLSIVPLIGFSYDHQRIKTKQKHHHSDSFSVDSSYNAFCSNPSSNPFSSSSEDYDIASKLGIDNHHDSSSYRFTWYGPLAGLDILYVLDPCWTLYAEFQGHFLSHVHCKRKSHTGISFIDDYHHTGSAYGFDGSVGTCFTLCEDWFCNLDVDYKWWKADNKRNDLKWDSIGINISLGYMF